MRSIALDHIALALPRMANGGKLEVIVLTIDVDPSGVEGPVAIELAATRPVALPAGPVPELRTTFRLTRS